MKRVLATLYIFISLACFQSAMGQQISAPCNVLVQKGDEAGSVEVKWKDVTGAIDYRVQYSYSDTDLWLDAGVTPDNKLIVKGLKPGRKYYFRVQGHKGSEMGRWCPAIIQYTGGKSEFAELLKQAMLIEDVR